MPSNLNRLAGSSHAQSSPMIPLPDSASTLEWSSLLDAAKAFEGKTYPAIIFRDRGQAICKLSCSLKFSVHR